MTEPIKKIDHKKEAARLLKKCEDTGSQELQRTYAARAQTHATLALVEQQRVSNLIALRTILAESLVGIDNYRQPGVEAIMPVIELIDDQIKEGIKV
jgi:hypothetical protein